MIFLKQIKYVGIAFLLTGCSDSNSIYISSRVDHSFDTYIRSIETNKIRITIQSSGGDTRDAERLSEYLLTKSLSLDVDGYCYSACSEFILPAAETIVFTSKPLIGFHWSPIMDYHQYVEAGADMSHCHFDLTTQKKLIEKRKLNAGFWKEIEIRLKLTKFQLVDKTGESCPWKVREFDNQMWFPTSQQLRKLWGLRFNGAVCADDFEECTKKIDKYWAKGDRVIVGDDVYVAR